MTILLVRHGETAGNANRVIQRPDVPLNERGIRQAERLADRVVALGFAHVLCSDLLRAQMTAAPLRARGIPVEDTPLLQEQNFGDLRGTSWTELTADPFALDFVPPNGESPPVFYRRVAQAFELIIERRRSVNGALLVITHGLVCRALFNNHVRIAALPPRYDNTALSIVDHEPPYDVRLAACIAHLAGGPDDPNALGLA